MLKLRIISAVVMILVFLICFFVLPPIFFRILIYIITAIVMVELFKLLEHCWVTKKDLQKRIYTISSVLTGLSILIISEFNLLSQSGNENVPSLYRFFFMYGMIIWILPVIPWISKKKSFKQKVILAGYDRPALDFPTTTIFYPIHIFLPLACSFLYLFTYDKHYLFFVLLIIWLADTGAYIAGKRFGRIKIAENISPGKTLEGVIGAIVINIIFMLVVGLNFSEFNIIGGIIFGFIVTLLSIYGDLFISWIKRSARVKDTGNLIPGHGGFLDRVDSLLLALPFAALIKICANAFQSNFLTI